MFQVFKFIHHKLLLGASLCLLLSFPGHAQEMDIRYLQVMLGQLDAEESWVIDQDQDQLVADIDDMIYGGVAAQLGVGDGMFQYGLETGGLVSFDNDTSSFTRVDNSGATTVLRVTNNMWLFDVSIGGFVSFRPWHSIRVYASGGPAILIGSMSIKEDDIETVDDEGNPIVYTPTDRETTVDAGVYARAGIDIILPNGFMFGASARKINGELDFKDAGTLDLDDTQFFLSLGKAF